MPTQGAPFSPGGEPRGRWGSRAREALGAGCGTRGALHIGHEDGLEYCRNGEALGLLSAELGRCVSGLSLDDRKCGDSSRWTRRGIFVPEDRILT